MRWLLISHKHHASLSILILTTILIVPCLIFLDLSLVRSEDTDSREPKYKVLHIMSYHSPWKWTDDQFNGFKDALDGLQIEYRVYQMDTKRNNSVEWKRKTGMEARDLIDKWKPDLVYTTDDNAQEYVVKHYINRDIPFVFSGVNAAPEKYGFDGSNNVTGVLEREHFLESVKLLKSIVPSVRRIAVILHDGPTWIAVGKRMRKQAAQIHNVDFISWDSIEKFSAFKKRIKELQSEADAIALIGVFNFKDAHGENVPYEEVLKWTAENSNLPDFSFWRDRVTRGTLCAVTESGYEQGLAAGKIARGILEEQKPPKSYPISATVKGRPVLSLVRANKLGISVKTRLLLSAEVIESFYWAKK